MSENVEYVKKIVETLKARGEVFCTAESCTGGQISKTVTDLAGVSAVFFGGGRVICKRDKGKAARGAP